MESLVSPCHLMPHITAWWPIKSHHLSVWSSYEQVTNKQHASCTGTGASDMEGRQKLLCVQQQRNAAGKSMLAPWTYSYLIESTGRPVHLFRLSYTSWLSQRSGSPAQLQQCDSSSRCHQDKPRGLENVAVTLNLSLCFWTEQTNGLCLHYSHVFLGVKEMWLM